MPASPAPLLDNVIRFVEIASVALKRAMDDNDVHAAMQKKAAAKAASTLDRLVAAGLVNRDQKQAAAAMLGDHAGTLDFLNLAIGRIEQTAPKTAGDGRDPTDRGHAGDGRADGNGKLPAKRAFDSLTDPHVGRRTSERKESDRRLFQGLGIQLPD